MRTRLWLAAALIAVNTLTAHAAVPAYYVFLDLRTENFQRCPGTITDINRIQPSNVAFQFSPDFVAETVPYPESCRDEPATMFPPQRLLYLADCAAGIGGCEEVRPCGCEQRTVREARDRDVTAWLAWDFVLANVHRTTDRWISRKGDTVRIYALTDKNLPSGSLAVAIEEVERKSVLSRDIVTLLKVASAIAGLQDEEGDLFQVSAYEYRLTKQRANITIAATVKEDDVVAQTAIAKIVSGPAEHLYLAADLPITAGEQLSFDSESNAIVARDDPTTVYASVNFRTGDLFTDQRWRQKWVIKALVSASRRPLDGYGIGLGVRGDVFGRWGVSFDSFSPYVAWMSVRNTDEAVQRGEPERTSNVRFGLSFNLDKAVEWLTPDDAEN